MTPDQAVERLILAAECFLGFEEVPPGTNRGQVVEAFLASVGLGPGHPWCAAAVTHCGVLACGDEWPVPKTGYVQSIVNWARQRDVFQDKHDEPQPGDLMVLWSPKLKRYAHIGIVRRVELGRVECLEGNTNDGGSREGFKFLARWRARPASLEFDPAMRFIRWVTALGAAPNA